MGYALHGHELTPEITPVQARLGWAVGWRKPEFWGRDVLLAERERGPARLSRGLLALDRGVPRADMDVVDDDGQVVGRTTSGTFSPSLKQGIALALLEPAVAGRRRGRRPGPRPHAAVPGREAAVPRGQDPRDRLTVPPDAVRMALGTLTALPVPPPRRLDAPVPGRAMLLAPAAGLVPGLAALAAVAGADVAGLSPLVAATLGVAALALTTRGLHLDGLADTADGLAASYDRDRALAVMKRGDVGPAGLATVVLVLLVQVAALAQAVTASSVTVLVAAVAARTAVPLACARGVPAARPDGARRGTSPAPSPAAAGGVRRAGPRSRARRHRWSRTCRGGPALPRWRPAWRRPGCCCGGPCGASAG